MAMVASAFLRLVPRFSTSSVRASVSAARRLLKVATRWLKARLHFWNFGGREKESQKREGRIKSLGCPKQKLPQTKTFNSFTSWFEYQLS